jgi:hypothetical protein
MLAASSPTVEIIRPRYNFHVNPGQWIYRTMTPPKPSSRLAVAAGNGSSSVPDRDQLVPIVSDWVSLQARPGLKETYSCYPGAPCIYENRRTKPGLKGGAVESLNQRLGICQVKPIRTHTH